MSPPPPPRPPHRNLLFIPHVCAVVICLIFFLLSLIFYRRISRKRTVPASLKPPFTPQKFSFSLLRRATDSFSACNLLGQGGYGSVYRGILDSGQEIAVKLMKEGSNGGEHEFHNEIALGSSMDTVVCPHIVCLLGFSTAGDEREYRSKYFPRWKKMKQGRKIALIYEYMHNGSLQDALFDRKCKELTDWNKRFEVIISVAKGLYCLHHYCEPPIIHGDIKPSNILLDSNFEAKISDFGLAQALSPEKEDAVALNVGPPSTDASTSDAPITTEKPKQKCWASLKNEEEIIKKPREWWKEEFCDELSKKKKKKTTPMECEERSFGRKSSTPSMRGTVCYIAPEYYSREHANKKCDVYSFGVLVLVIISGRRPLEVTASPMAELDKGNLISWARQLAINGRLLDLVDPLIISSSLKTEQVGLCIRLALLCLQRSPEKRPAMEEILEILKGNCEAPQISLESSPSPPVSCQFGNRACKII